MKPFSVIVFLLAFSASAQSDSLMAVCRNCDSIQLYRNLDPFYKKLYEASAQKSTAIKIVQIGDSHVQMGHFSGGIEMELKKDFPQLTNTSFRFPYALTGGWNPAGLNVDTSGPWRGEKMVGSQTETHFGLTGHALVLKGSKKQRSKLTIKLDGPVESLQFLMEANGDWKIASKDAEVAAFSITEDLAIITIRPKGKSVRFVIDFLSKKKHPQPMRVFGFRKVQVEEGLTFESYGSSGGKYSDYAGKCSYCDGHLGVLKPDLLIVSLGTNDAFGSYQGQSYYELVTNYIGKIRAAHPDAAILLTTQPDTYYQEKKPTSDSLVYNTLLYAASDHRCAVWNLAAVMGGNESIHWWFAEGLAGKDMLHFTQGGYAFQAQLLVEALMKGYAAYQAELKIKN